MKRCSKCKEPKDKSEFYKNKAMKDGLENYCKICSINRAKNYYEKNRNNKLRRETIQKQNERFFNNSCAILDWNKTVNGRYCYYRNNANKRGFEFSLTKDQFFTFWGKNCEYCKNQITSIGLDRINNDIGYVIGNVVSCCEICNRCKLNMGFEKWKQYLQQISIFQKGGGPLILCEEKVFNKNGYNTRFTQYKYRAKIKKHNFRLSKEYFEHLLVMPCHYCGSITPNIGIDRKNNNLGYLLENCLPCCKNCNSGKRNNTYEVFMSWIKRITKIYGNNVP